jgi:hypothetical protein
MILPNLIIAGAPKCGTSSLFSWLVDHPDVCGSKIKEPFFLMDKDNPLRRSNCNFHDNGLKSYSSFFSNCAGNQRIIVEATTHYIYQKTAPEVLKSLPTTPKIVFLLRKPSERLFSSYAFSKQNLASIRGDVSFSEFVDLINGTSDRPKVERELGESGYVLARDIQYSRYVDYLCTWRDAVGIERIRIVLFESMRLNPKGVMVDLCDWLGLDSQFYDSYDFEVQNPTVVLRNRSLHRIARALARNIPRGAVKTLLKRPYRALQRSRRARERSELDRATLLQLDESFRPFNDRLAREFGIDLSVWE